MKSSIQVNLDLFCELDYVYYDQLFSGNSDKEYTVVLKCSNLERLNFLFQYENVTVIYMDSYILDDDLLELIRC